MMDPPTTRSRPSAARQLAKRWPWILVAGLAGVVLGIVLLLNPITTALALAWLVAFALVIEGVGTIFEAGRHDVSWPSYVLGAIWIATGIVAVAWPGLTLLALAWIIGIGFLVGAIAQAAFTLTNFGQLQYRWLALAVAVLTGLGGLVVLAWPAITVVVLADLLGLRVFFQGLATTWFALTIRRFA